MNKDEIKERLERISEQIDSPDSQFQAAALEAFIDLITTESLTSDQKKVILPFLETILKGENSPLKTAGLKVTCLIGMKEFELIVPWIPLLIQECTHKNRYRAEIIIDFLLSKRNSNHQVIQDFIKQFLKESPIWFNDPYLLSVPQKFWKEALEKDFQFLDKYSHEIQEALDTYPDHFEKIKEIIKEKIKQYGEYLKDLQKKREEEERLRKEKKKQQEERLRKEEEYRKKKKIEQEEMKKKLEEYVQTIAETKEPFSAPYSQDQTEKSSQKTVASAQSDAENSDSFIRPANQEEAPEFVSFTSLGLKRKNDKKPENL